MTPAAPEPLSVFISYSHRDEDLKDELVIHLANLKRQGKIRAWQDRDIEAGTEWDAEIKQQLEAAEIILLLITPRFIASDYCYDLEMQQALQRHAAGSARVIPIILKPCDWQDSPFSKLQVLPKDAKPMTKCDNQDEASLNIAQGIRRAAESLQAKKSSGATLPNLPTVAPHPSSITPHPSSLPSSFSTYNPATFTGREAETRHLTSLLSGNCRILAIVGMTGIGKTALAERVVAHLMQASAVASLPYIRFSLDDRSLTPDFFNSGVALLRTLGAEPTLADQQDPTNLLAHLLNHLQSHPCRLQIDSLERLLKGNEQEGWSEFCDPLWLDLLQQFLAATDSPSQLLLTSQDIPADLDTVASRYPQFWRCTALQGLSADEQQTLFQKLGLPQDADSLDYLSRIGEFYNGHPLVLQVIADEIRQPPFQGNIARYWHHYAAEFTATPAKLSRSRLYRRRVRQRVEQSLHRLPALARQMLCASAVFRRPVPVEFWYAMLADDPAAAFDTLQDRHLVEFAPSLDDRTLLLVRQHNLIRSVAYDLLKADTPTWETAERQTAHLWLTAYEPAPNAPNIETVRGYLEAFDHYYEVGDWGAAKNILLGQKIGVKLQTWGRYQEMILLYQKLIDRLPALDEVTCKRGLGNAYYFLSNYSQAISYYQQSLELACEIGDRRGEGAALGNLGNAYYSLGQYERAIDFHQQHLTMAREVGNRQGEGTALGSLGNAYYRLGNYERAIDFHQQDLAIAREIGNRRGEGGALGNLGSAYYRLGNYEQAIDLYQQYLAIAREIGDRLGEGVALVNMGATQLKRSQYSESLTHNQTALAIFREISSRNEEAEALKNLAELHQALGEVEVARQYCQQALVMATELGIPLKAECEILLEELEKGARL